MAAQYIEPMKAVAEPRLNGLWPRLAWPSPCPVCGQWSQDRVCHACMLRFAPARPRCLRCAIPLGNLSMSICGRCATQPPPFAHAVCGLDYQFPWDRLIAAFKFGADLSLLPALSHTLLAALQQPGAAAARNADLVIPMPLSARRLRERGFNQSWELARQAAAA